MKKEEFDQLFQEKVVFLDGGTGSNLQKAGMPVGCCPEQWILDHAQVMIKLQEEYVKAGCQIVYAPTFTSNRIKLQEYGLEDQIIDMNQRLVAISKEAVDGKALVAGDLTMTGVQLYPIGKMKTEELIEIYKEQAKILVDAGVDLFVIETMMSLAETRAAVIAIKEVCDLPIMATLSFNEDGRTLFGTDPKTAVIVLQSLGVDAIGANCSAGPQEMLPIIEEMSAISSIPIIAKPNAGLPELIDGNTVYSMGPEEFSEHAVALVNAGAQIIGGCCGTTPEHMHLTIQKLSKMQTKKLEVKKDSYLASERSFLKLQLDDPFRIIGERINPTGKPKLQEQLRANRFDLVLEMAEKQELAGASILDINVGMNGIDEKETMVETIMQVSSAVNLPLCIDSSYIDVIEAALRVYPGRALINSISLEEEKIKKLLPIAKKYGAMFIVLPLSDKGLPKDLEEKKHIIHTIMNKALALGIGKENMIVDGLVATVGANNRAALETLETIEYCKQTLGLLTCCGLSNISFGLPTRIVVNTAFLSMAISKGLSMAIANPNQELLVNMAFATDLLLNKEGANLRYIERMNQLQEAKEETINPKEETKSKESEQAVYEMVLKGNKDRIVSEVDLLLEKGQAPDVIINEMLIPAINHVGELFNQQKYFLPQLIMSAEAMKTAVEYLEPRIERKEDGSAKQTVVIATVEGDIHDIGKNLVALMLRNYGYRVIDLGKDVDKDTIVSCAKKEQAAIIGLSALMTTTMMRMKDVVEEVKKRNLNTKVIIGGAVITQSFADEIGADGYSKDAADAVKLVQRLLS